jgi:hypothetical protein
MAEDRSKLRCGSTRLMKFQTSSDGGSKGKNNIKRRQHVEYDKIPRKTRGMAAAIPSHTESFALVFAAPWNAWLSHTSYRISNFIEEELGPCLIYINYFNFQKCKNMTSSY